MRQSDDGELILFASCLLAPLRMAVSVNQCLWEESTPIWTRCERVDVCEGQTHAHDTNTHTLGE